MALDLSHHVTPRKLRHGVASRRRRMPVLTVVAIFIVFVGMAWAWAFHRHGGTAGSGGIPVLVADSHPTRERPANPGGMQVSDIDPLSYDSGRDPPKVENILPAPEQPLPQPAPPPVVVKAQPAPAAPPPTAATTGNVASSAAEPAANPQPAAAVAPIPAVQSATPQPVEVAFVEPPPPKPRPPRVAAAQPAVPSAHAVKPAAAARAMANDKPSARPSTVPPVASGGGPVYLQLAATHSATDALEVGQRLRARFGGLLRSFAFNYAPVDLGPRGVYYRIMAGPVSASRAASICQTLRRRGAACLVAGR